MSGSSREFQDVVDPGLTAIFSSEDLEGIPRLAPLGAQGKFILLWGRDGGLFMFTVK